MTEGPSVAARRIHVTPNRVGLVIVLAAILWIAVSGYATEGSVAPMAGLVLGVTAAFVLGSKAGSRRPVVPLTIVMTAFLVALLTGPSIFSSDPISGPFGYANAKGQFFVQASAAGLMLVVLARRPELRVVGGVAMVSFALVPVLSRSIAAGVLAVLILCLCIAVLAGVGVRWTIPVSAVGLALGLLTTIALGATAPNADSAHPSGSVIVQSLSARRLFLWHDALAIIGQHPVTGIGIGRFSVASPTARDDPDDAHWAHQEFLQVGAEAGVLGFILLASVFAWAFVRLWISDLRTASAVAAAAVAALGIHACIDYVLHFPVIPIMTAALVGSAISSD
jgi:O-antigen ligase